MTAVAIVDLGTARAKLTIASSNGSEVTIKQLKWDVGLGDGSEQSKSRILETARLIADAAAAESAKIARTIATEAFRSDEGLRSQLPSIGKLLGDVDLLSPSVEAQLLWQGVHDCVLNREPGVVLDIGGGSIQLVWGDSDEEFCSIPAGTFALERKFQERSEALAPDEAQRMRVFVGTGLDPVRARIPKHLPLVVGSNIMADFFSSALVWAGEASLDESHGRVSNAAIELLEEKIICKRYNDVYEAFKANPKFMHGADKALIVLRCAIDAVKPTAIIPTNEALSTALARSYIAKPLS
ncbi:MAG: hypothetical protein GC129_03700 [Proteobacteria bacterium]|nr:hypothetical protein [Pseudomonadota bacterium]